MKTTYFINKYILLINYFYNTLKINVLFIVCVFFVATKSHSQDYNQYQPLLNKGLLPIDFTMPSSEKYRKDVKNIGNTSKGDDRKTKSNFYLENNFSVDQMLRSGRILYDESLTKYIYEILDVLLKDKPDLRRQVRVYLLRSPSVNAFATSSGVIFINMGLLSHLENEAQLAFILSHELTHIERKHSLDLYIEAKKIDKNISRYDILRRNDYDEVQLSRHRFSKEKESEADDYGLQTYVKTNYDIAAIDAAFDVLKYAEQPFEELPFEKSIFENEDLKIPDSYLLEKVNPIKGQNEYTDDRESTHPNLAKRRAAVAKKLALQKPKGDQLYIVSQAKFEELQKAIRFEMPQLYLHNRQQQDAIYHSFLLSKQFPNNPYLQQSIAKALYTLTKYNNSNRYVMEADSIQGEVQQVYQLFSKMSAKDLNIITLRYFWDLKKRLPNSEEIKLMGNDIYKEFVEHHDDVWAKLSKKPLAKVLAERTALELKRSNDSTEVERPKEEKKKKKSKKKIDKTKEVISDTITSDWSRFAFVDLLNSDTAFVKMHERLKAEKIATDSLLREDYGAYVDSSKDEEQKGVRMGIPKVVFVNPLYMNLDARDENNAIQFFATEDGQTRFVESLRENAKLARLKINVLDVHQLKSNDATTFNEIMLLNEWVSEQQEAETLLIYGTQQARINAIAKKYDTDFFVWTGVVSMHETKNIFKTGLLLLAGIGYLPMMPFSIYESIKPEYNTLFFCTIYDVKTGRLKSVKYDYMKRNDTRALLNSQLYDALLQIRKE